MNTLIISLTWFSIFVIFVGIISACFSGVCEIITSEKKNTKPNLSFFVDGFIGGIAFGIISPFLVIYFLASCAVFALFSTFPIYI